MCVVSAAVGAPQTERFRDDPGGVIDVGSRRQLFFDHRFIARSENVEITMNPPVKRGVVLEYDRPWEDSREQDGLRRAAS